MSIERLRATLGAGFTMFILALGTLGFSSPAQAKQNAEDTIHVIQPRPVLQRGRVDLTPRFGASINDAMLRSYKVGGNINIHFTERLYLGGLFEWYQLGNSLGGPTDSYKEVRNETQSAADAPVLHWAGGLELGYAPIAGKFTLFNSFIFFYDLSITAGGAWANSASLALPASSGGVGMTWSVSNRVFLSRWVALNFEIRDMMFFANLRGMNDVLSHVVTASGGLSFYFPLSFEYKQDPWRPAE